MLSWMVFFLWTAPADFEVSGVREFRVDHTTTVEIPADVEMLRVYHGVPEPGGWASGSEYAAQSPRLTPFGWALKDNPPFGPAWLWEQAAPHATRQTFESHYQVRSADRRLKLEALKLSWDSF